MGQSGGIDSNIDTKALLDAVRGVRGVGDAFGVLTSVLGIPHCDRCEARRHRWNRLFRAAHADHPLDGWSLSRGGTGDAHP
jgi:hypothetical protein